MDVHCPCYHLVNPSPLAWAVVTLGISNKRSKGSSRQGCGHGQAKFIMAWKPQPPCPTRHKVAKRPRGAPTRRTADTHGRVIHGTKSSWILAPRRPSFVFPSGLCRRRLHTALRINGARSATCVHSRRAEQRAEMSGHQCWLPPDGVNGDTPDGGGGCWLWTGDWRLEDSKCLSWRETGTRH